MHTKRILDLYHKFKQIYEKTGNHKSDMIRYYRKLKHMNVEYQIKNNSQTEKKKKKVQEKKIEVQEKKIEVQEKKKDLFIQRLETIEDISSLTNLFINFEKEKDDNLYYHDNTLFFIAKTENRFYLVNNLTKTKDILEKKKIKDNYHIYNVSEDFLKKFPLKKNDIFFTIFILGKNNKDWLQNIIPFLLKQDYSNYEIIYIDENDNNESIPMMKNLLQSVPYYIIKNKKNKQYIENLFLISRLSKENSFILPLRKHYERIKDKNYLKELNYNYYGTNCLVSYDNQQFGKNIPYLKGWLRELCLCIHEDSIQSTNEYYDLCLLYPLLKIAGKNRVYEKEYYFKTIENKYLFTLINFRQYKKIFNIEFIIQYYIRGYLKNDCIQKNKYLGLHLTKYLRPSNLKLYLFNNVYRPDIYQNFHINQNETSILLDSYKDFKDILYNQNDYTKINNYNVLCKDFLNYNLNINIFEKDFLYNSIKHYFIFDIDKKYEWNIIIPFSNRHDNLYSLLENFNICLKNKINYILTVVEISNVPTLLEKYKNNFNYIWIPRYLLDCFHKLLCGNITYKLYKNKYDYQYILWHDVDCCITSDFLENIKKDIIKYPNSLLRTYHSIHFTKKEEAEYLRRYIENIDTKKKNEKVLSPGGSILFTKEMFEKINLFNTSIFYNYSAEDCFINSCFIKKNFQLKINTNNTLVHLWHETFSSKPFFSNKHFYFQEKFFELFSKS